MIQSFCRIITFYEVYLWLLVTRNYKQSIKSAFPELDDIEKTLKDGLNSLVLSAIIEKIDNTTYKKHINLFE